jgi:hypothetical protein
MSARLSHQDPPGCIKLCAIRGGCKRGRKLQALSASPEQLDVYGRSVLPSDETAAFEGTAT